MLLERSARSGSASLRAYGALAKSSCSRSRPAGSASFRGPRVPPRHMPPCRRGNKDKFHLWTLDSACLRRGSHCVTCFDFRVLSRGVPIKFSVLYDGISGSPDARRAQLADPGILRLSSGRHGHELAGRPEAFWSNLGPSGITCTATRLVPAFRCPRLSGG